MGAHQSTLTCLLSYIQERSVQAHVHMCVWVLPRGVSLMYLHIFYVNECTWPNTNTCLYTWGVNVYICIHPWVDVFVCLCSSVCVYAGTNMLRMSACGLVYDSVCRPADEVHAHVRIHLCHTPACMLGAVKVWVLTGVCADHMWRRVGLRFYVIFECPYI